MLHQDFTFGSGRERMAQMRTEVEHNRLEGRLAKATRSNERFALPRGMVARRAAVVTALFR